MTDRYPKSKGGAWINKKRANDKHPHLRGHINVTPEQIAMLAKMHKAGLEPRLHMAVWKSRSQAGQPYLSFVAEAYMQDQAAPAAPAEDDPLGFDEDIPF